MKINIKIKADGHTVRHAEISGSSEEQAALVEILDLVMPSPLTALTKLQSQPITIGSEFAQAILTAAADPENMEFTDMLFEGLLELHRS